MFCSSNEVFPVGLSKPVRYYICSQWQYAAANTQCNYHPRNTASGQHCFSRNACYNGQNRLIEKISYMPLFAARLRNAFLPGLLILALLGGCASTQNPRDPLEPLNRVVYKANDGLDKVLLKPVATVYK